MNHLPDLIRDLCFILGTAAIIILIFRKLKQPVVLGYLIAGLLVGPHVSFTPTVIDINSIKVWAEIGIIFLLFGLGLEFSFRKLIQVGKSAIIIALFEIIFMFAAGYSLGQAFSLGRIDSLFLGAILAISSTTIIVRAFDELGLKNRKFVSLVFGVLIVEDIVAILIMVLLTTIAVSQTFSGAELTQTSLKLIFFIILWFVIGLYLVPMFLKKIRNLMTAETTLIVSIGLCLMMVLLASSAGFSPALGAFVMGSILAETKDGQAIEHLILPVKDLFAAIFFVSVGMLINPQTIIENLWLILAVSVVTVAGKFFSSAFGAVISGQSLKSSVQVGMSLAQIGEFSFIIATLGTALNVTSEKLYPIAVAVSVITTFTTPYQIKYAEVFYYWLERRLPERIINQLGNYQKVLATKSEEHMASVVWNLYGMKILLNSVIIVAITLIISRLVSSAQLDSFGNYDLVARIGICLLIMLICAPFFWPIVFAQPSESALSRVKNFRYLRYLQLGIVSVRLLIGLVLIGFIVSQFFSVLAASGLVIILLTAMLLFIVKKMKIFYIFFERQFMLNLREKEDHESEQIRSLPSLAPWDASMAHFTMSQDSPLVGKSLIDSKIKESFGITLVMIERGKRKILAPGRNEMLMPQDRLFVIGSDSQLENVRSVIEGNQKDIVESHIENFGLESLVIKSNVDFVGKQIRDSGLREKINGLIVGIERDGERILSPDSTWVLLKGDIVWVVGDRSLIRAIAKATN